MRDYFEEIKNNPKFLTGIAIGIVAVIGLFVIVRMDIQSTKQAPNLSDEVALLPDEGIPADLFIPFEREVIEEAPEPEPPKEKERVNLNITDIFKIKTSPEPVLSEDELLRQELEKNRKGRGQVKVIGQPENKVRIPENLEFEDMSKDEDFSKHGLAMDIPTYPVDLSRTLTADRFIPAVLVTEVKSELPSAKVIAMVEQDVYAAHGEKILIPRGSKAIGSYEPLAEVDSERLMIAWNRIITPDGINIKIDSETADGEGAAGQTGTLDNRLVDKYSTALLFSSLSALAQLSVSADDERQAAAAEAFSGEFGTVTAESLRNSLDILPRVRIRKGARLNISPLNDIWFAEPVRNQAEVFRVKDLQETGRLGLARFQRKDGDPIFLSENDLDTRPIVEAERLSNRNDFGVKSNDNNNPSGIHAEVTDADFMELLNK